mmetsp:Transcript_28826/g.87182  ORF Transcript_28826/g.87182 Transcript_28826/m.87182 type:complete len:374 (+) Transcript_28826:1541-2662(+)
MVPSHLADGLCNHQRVGFLEALPQILQVPCLLLQDLDPFFHGTRQLGRNLVDRGPGEDFLDCLDVRGFHQLPELSSDLGVLVGQLGSLGFDLLGPPSRIHRSGSSRPSLISSSSRSCTQLWLPWLEYTYVRISSTYLCCLCKFSWRARISATISPPTLRESASPSALCSAATSVEDFRSSSRCKKPLSACSKRDCACSRSSKHRFATSYMWLAPVATHVPWFLRFSPSLRSKSPIACWIIDLFRDHVASRMRWMSGSCRSISSARFLPERQPHQLDGLRVFQAAQLQHDQALGAGLLRLQVLELLLQVRRPDLVFAPTRQEIPDLVRALQHGEDLVVLLDLRRRHGQLCATGEGGLHLLAVEGLRGPLELDQR